MVNCNIKKHLSNLDMAPVLKTKRPVLKQELSEDNNARRAATVIK